MRQLLDRIEQVIEDLGCPEAVWFRGHVAEHRLLPSLLRLSEGMDNEHQIIDGYEYREIGSKGENSGHDPAMLTRMYNSYRPTRLLAWTQRWQVALFCALVKGSKNPTVFVMDPFALNALSGITGLLKSPTAHDHRFLDWSDPLLLEHPIAVDARASDLQGPAVDGIFTLHGRNRLPLEEQCSACVRKIVLTEAEKSLASQSVLDSDWSP